ncbi:TIGR00341 family protein [Mangrovactinospora gilvigrisea]|uniref:TIGR00341 family protein n=1 Tax=Mangrovactinospora gilvigrisea TaxID=1428644 RepID=A0A1J7BDW5_9ACTN|nr:TIGR00341 family protein [Mangrovactinospora gilvigrisea]OIV36773.1 TIGR00341 family protein [Mangrovactinospora gilvigrisea]
MSDASSGRRVDAAAARRMAQALFIERSWRSPSSSRFWVLLVLAAVIATSGVVSDSTATVIGAMIVAPLMTPILGSALALVLADRRRVLRSALLVLLGALAVVAIGALVGLIVSPPDAFASNSQVSSRISPRLIDLIAALATGTVGAFALVRTDISDTLPGVAIAISLVPPLAVTGLLLTVGRYHDAGESALLFATNVAAIVATGTLVFLAYDVRRAARAAGMRLGRFRGWTLAAVGAVVLLIATPLTFGTLSVARDRSLAARAQPVAEAWAAPHRWEIASVDAHNGTVVVGVLGLPPQPAPAELRVALDRHGMAGANLQINLVGGRTHYCPAHRASCTIQSGTISLTGTQD